VSPVGKLTRAAAKKRLKAAPAIARVDEIFTTRRKAKQARCATSVAEFDHSRNRSVEDLDNVEANHCWAKSRRFERPRLDGDGATDKDQISRGDGEAGV
jgi:hypothetical protein